jgi:hypothetical protein
MRHNERQIAGHRVGCCADFCIADLFCYNAVGIIKVPTEEEMAAMEAERRERRQQAKESA